MLGVTGKEGFRKGLKFSLVLNSEVGKGTSKHSSKINVLEKEGSFVRHEEPVWDSELDQSLFPRVLSARVLAL